MGGGGDTFGKDLTKRGGGVKLTILPKIQKYKATSGKIILH